MWRWEMWTASSRQTHGEEGGAVTATETQSVDQYKASGKYHQNFVLLKMSHFYFSECHFNVKLREKELQIGNGKVTS